MTRSKPVFSAFACAQGKIQSTSSSGLGKINPGSAEGGMCCQTGGSQIYRSLDMVAKKRRLSWRKLHKGIELLHPMRIHISEGLSFTSPYSQLTFAYARAWAFQTEIYSDI